MQFPQLGKAIAFFISSIKDKTALSFARQEITSRMAVSVKIEQ